MYIHDFWVELFPMFSENPFIYYFLDIVTILCMLKFFLSFFGAMLNGRKYF